MSYNSPKYYKMAEKVGLNVNQSSSIFLFPTLIPLSFSSCCDKDSAIIFTTDRLPDVNPP
jgi:hypothetical protein